METDVGKNWIVLLPLFFHQVWLKLISSFNSKYMGGGGEDVEIAGNLYKA